MFPGTTAENRTAIGMEISAAQAMGERDVYGAQQHAPLVNFAFEL